MKRDRSVGRFERLEDRAVPAALLDILPGGVLVYTGSAVNNNLTISDTSPSGSGQYFFNDTGETITLGPGALALLWTGNATNTVQGPDGSVNTMLIDTDGGNDVVNVASLTDPININTDVGVPDTTNIGSAGNVDGVLGDVFVQDTGGVGNININDFNNPNPKTIAFDNAIGARITGVLPAGHTINYGAGVTQIDFNGGFGGNTISVNMPTNDTLDLLNLNSGDGSDQVTVTAVNAGLTLNINTEIGGADATTIGNGTLDNILGFVTVQDSGGVSTLTLDDSTDASGRNVTFTNGLITGATPNPIVYQPGVTTLNYNGGNGLDTLTVNMPVNDDLGTFNLNSGGGDDTNNIQAVNAGLTVNVNSQNGIPDTTNVGSTAPNLATSVLATIQGTVNVQDSGGVGALNISDAGNAAPETFTLTDAQLTGTAFTGLITYGSGITDVRLDGGSGGNVIQVSSTKAGTNTLVNSGDGDDTVNVVSTAGPLTVEGNAGSDVVNIGNSGIAGVPGTVQNINGQVTLRKTGAGELDANVDDTSNAGVTNATLRFNAGTGFAELTGQAPATIRYIPGEVGTLAVNTGPASDSVTVDFVNGNPLPFGATNGVGGLDYTGQGNGLLVLINDLPTGPFLSEDSTATGPGAGDIDLVDSGGAPTHIRYSGLSPVNDTTSVINYTFTSPPFPAQNVSITDTVVNGFNGTRISDAANAFERQDISNKQNVTINVGTPFTLFPIDVSVLLNNPNAAAGAHNTPLLSMTVNTFAGDDAVQITATPAIPNVSVTTDGGDDAVSVLGAGVPAGTLLFLDGGPGLFDTLNYDAGGAAVVAAAGPAPGEVIITGPNGTVDAINFESIVITNAAPTPPVFNPPLTVNTVEGFQLVDVDVATFTSAAPGATAEDFTATIDWGDGSPVTAGVIVQDANVPSIFYVRGTHTYQEQGSFTVNTTVASTGSTSTTTINGVPVTFVTGPSGPVGPTVTANVTSDNAALALTVNPLSGVEGTAVPSQVIANFIDAGGASDPSPASDYTATINFGDGTTVAGVVAQNGSSNSYTVTAPAHVYAHEGTYQVSVTVVDADLPPPVVTVTATAPAFIADAPLTTPTGIPVAATEGLALTNVPVFSFVDTNPLGTTADFIATIDWGDGSDGIGTVTQPGGVGTPFVVTGNHTYQHTGTYTILVNVVGSSISGSSTATVADAPLTAPVGIPVSAVEGQPLQAIPVGTFVDTNQFGTASDFTVTINWGDGTPATTGIVTVIGGTAATTIFQVSGSHVYAEQGLFPITVNVTGDGGAATVINTQATVADAPLTAEGATITGTEGISTGSVLVATFSDADPTATVADFTATINWGDGTAPTAGTITAVGTPNGVTFRVNGAHTYAEVGVYQITVAIAEAAGSQTVAHGQAVIADAPLTTPLGIAVTATEGTALTNVPVFSFVDTNPGGVVGDFTATIDWGDETTSLGTITQPGGAGTPFVVTGNHTYAEEGTYTIKVNVESAAGSRIGGTTTATVADAPLTTPVGFPVAAQEGSPLIDVPLGTFIDTNKFATTGDFTVTINWGDGTPVDTTTGTVTLVGGTAAGLRFRVSGSHTFTTEGTFPITVTVTDKGGQTITIPGTAVSATVAQAPLFAQGATITGVEGQPITNVLVATFSDANPLSVASDFTAVINWGDGTSSAGTITKVGGANGSLYQVTGSHTYTEEGTFDVTTTINETVGGTVAIAHGSAVIADAALSAATQPVVNATEGSVFSGPVAAFVDANPFAPIGDFQAVIDWGDGTPHTLGIVSQPGGPGTTFIVSGTHTYKDAGVNGGIGTFPITVNVVDRGGATVTLQNTANVADRALVVNGILERSSDSGQSNSDGITNVTNPKFFGFTTEAGASVFLYAQRLGTSGLQLIGQDTSNGSRRWNITSDFLSDGRYNIFVQAVDSDGNTISALTPVAMSNGVVGPLTVDTVGPKVTNVAFARLSGQVFVTYQDELSGLKQASLIDANNYRFTKLSGPGHVSKFRVNFISSVPRGPLSTLPQTVGLTFNDARQIRGGSYLFTILSRSVLVKNGVQDVAGNAMDGEFYGFFPSGNNVRGGDFVAQLDARHNFVFAPKTVVGRATPVSPPGTLGTGFNVNNPPLFDLTSQKAKKK